MNKQKIIIILVGVLATILVGGLIFWRIMIEQKNTKNYSIMEITGDCERTQNNKNKEACYQKLFVLYNSQAKKDCATFPGASGAVCEKAKLVEEAVADKSETGCQKLDNEKERSSCEAQVLYGLAISNKEVKFCEKIKQADISTDCRSVIDKIKSVKTNI